MEAVDALKSVLCGPDGKCCIAGSQADRDTVDTALASVQHYLDQRKAELPVLSPQCEALPKLGESRWDGYERWAKGYGQQCAAHARKLALEEAKQFFLENDTNLFWGSQAAKAIEALKGK